MVSDFENFKQQQQPLTLHYSFEIEKTPKIELTELAGRTFDLKSKRLKGG